MNTFLVFNELSLSAPGLDLPNGRTALREFSNLLTDSRIKGTKVLVAPSHLLQYQVSEGYAIGRWLAEYEDHDRRTRIKSLVDRRVGYERYAPPAEERGNEEYLYAGEPTVGLSVALTIEGLALSIRTSENWDSASIIIEKNWVEAADIATRDFEVRHACRVDHLLAHLEWLDERETPLPTCGADLWESRADLFPRLDFCDSVRTQVTTLAGNEPRFRSVMRGLGDLQIYCDNWTTNYFDIHRLLNASGESKPTLDMYSDERTILCPDGRYRLFNWHLKRWGTRIHFIDVPATKRILIGYIGDHLRISSQ